jgi:hypothetical protein
MVAASLWKKYRSKGYLFRPLPVEPPSNGNCVEERLSTLDRALQCVLRGSQNKHRLWPYTTLTDFVQPRQRGFAVRYALSPYIIDMFHL